MAVGLQVHDMQGGTRHRTSCSSKLGTGHIHWVSLPPPEAPQTVTQDSYSRLNGGVVYISLVRDPPTPVLHCGCSPSKPADKPGLPKFTRGGLCRRHQTRSITAKRDADGVYLPISVGIHLCSRTQTVVIDHRAGSIHPTLPPRLQQKQHHTEVLLPLGLGGHGQALCWRLLCIRSLL